MAYLFESLNFWSNWTKGESLLSIVISYFDRKFPWIDFNGKPY